MHERPQDTRGITPGGWSRSSRRIKPPKQRDPLDNASLHRILIPHTVPCSPDAIREILHYSSSIEMAPIHSLRHFLRSQN